MDPIVAQNVTRCHPTGRGVQNISLSVPAGRCLGVLGANGSGKTTLTRLVAGFDTPDTGSLSVLGEPAHPRPSRLRRLCGIACDIPTHWNALTGRRNLQFFTRQYGLTGSTLRNRVDELLDLANLSERADEPVSDYSYAMRRKLTIIEALVHEPDLLILDEPSAGTDTTFLDRLANVIRHRCEQGRTTWIADDNADWLARTATDAVLLEQGRITATGSVEDLVTSLPSHCRIEILLEEPGFSAVPNMPGITEYRCRSNRITADLSDSAELPAEMLVWIVANNGRVKSMQIRSTTLREALLRTTDHAGPESEDSQ